MLLPRSKNIWVFGEGNLSVLKPLFEHSCIYKDSIKKVYISSDKARVSYLRSNGLNAYYKYDFLAYYFIARAHIHIICKSKLSDLNNYFSHNAIKINLFHGTPIKAVGLKCVEKKKGAIRKFLYERRIKRLKERYSNYIFLCGTSPYTNTLYSRCFGIKENDIKITGHPRNDLISTSPINRKFIAENLKMDVDSFTKVFTYMPTWRKYKWKHKINFEKINNFLLSINSILYIRSHHLDSSFDNFNNFSNIYTVRNKECNLHDSHHDLLGTDVLITDYSSLIYDFLLTRRPIIIYTPDYENYYKSSKFLVDFKSAIPAPQIYDSDKLIEEMRNAYEGNLCFEKYNNLLNLYHTQKDNKSSKRVYDEIKKICIS